MKVPYKFLLVIVCFLSIQTVATEKLSVSELLDRYAANRDKLKSFIVKTDSVYSYLTQEASTKQEKKRRFIEDFRYHDSGNDLAVYYGVNESNLGKDGIWIPEDNQSIFLWKSKRYYQYHKTPVLDHSSLKIVTSDDDYTDPTLGITLSYTGADPMLGLLSGDVERFDSILKQADSISLRDELEQVDSINCYVIDAKSKHGAYTVWLDPEHGYGIAKAELHKGSEDLIQGRPPTSFINMESYEGRDSFTENVKFENIEGIWIAVEANTRMVTKRRESIWSSHGHYKITQIDINPKHDELKSFVLDIQNGTSVAIIDEPRFECKWDDGKKFVKDEWDNSIKYVPKDWSIQAGVGKPLPEFEDIKLNLSDDETKDKVVLLCFFDMNQRPSRNCIKQLTQQADALEEKGIAVVIIQTSEVDEDKLKEWVEKNNNIAFPVGAITEDIEKARFTWGVRSLPWLILTNREQIVIAEGFGIDELDRELKKNISKERMAQKNKAAPTKPIAQTGLSDSINSFLDAEEILAGWESNYVIIRTMRVCYCTQLVDFQPPANDPNLDITDFVKYQHVERIEDGKRYHMRYSTAEDGFDKPESLSENAFDGKTSRDYSASYKCGSIFTGLKGWGVETNNDLKEYMLLGTPFKTPADLKDKYPNGVPELLMTFKLGMTEGTVTVRPKLESVAGQRCHVVEITLPGKDHKGIARQIKQVFWMAHDKGMCLMKYQWYWDDKLYREIEVKKIAMTDMARTGIWYPVKACKTIFYDEFGLSKYELTVSDFVPNVEVDENTFRFDFPPGTNVYDKAKQHRR